MIFNRTKKCAADSPQNMVFHWTMGLKKRMVPAHRKAPMKQSTCRITKPMVLNQTMSPEKSSYNCASSFFLSSSLVGSRGWLSPSGMVTRGPLDVCGAGGILRIECSHELFGRSPRECRWWETNDCHFGEN